MAKTKRSSDASEKPKKRLRKQKDEDDDRSTDGSDNGSDLEDFLVESESDSETEHESKSEDELAIAKKEAEKLTQNISATVVGGRSLRNRETLKKPEVYFDHEAFARINEEDEKKEKIAMLKKWAASGEYVCDVLKTLTKKSSSELVEQEYRKAKRALEIPDTDDEDESEDEQLDESEDVSSEDYDESDDEEELSDEDEESDDADCEEHSEQEDGEVK